MAEYSKEQQAAAYSAAEVLIEAARSDGSSHLDLSAYNFEPGGSQEEFSILAALQRLPPEIDTLTALRELNLDTTQISDLAPLASLTDLNEFSANGTAVSDLSPLTGLVGLRKLSLDETDVNNLSPLSALSKLESLSLNNTHVVDVSPLSRLRNLRILSLDDTQVDDLSPLVSLTELESLSLNNVDCDDLSPLSGLRRLTDLLLRNTKVAELTPLLGLTGLQSLSLDETDVSDLSPLSGCAALEYLSIDSTRTTDLNALSKLTNLRTLSLYGTHVSDLSPLATLPSLQNLRLGDTLVSELSPISFLTNLTGLSLLGTQVIDLGPLANLPGLKSLVLDRTRVSDLSPLSTLTTLDMLSFDETQISDLSSLATLDGLKTMWLSRTQVSDLSHLKGLTDLEGLDFSGSAVRDLRPLLPLRKLGTNSYPGFKYGDTPAIRADPTLNEISQIEDDKERAEKTLAYLATLPPWPEPLPWLPPADVPDAAPPPPEPDSVPRIDLGADGFDLAPSPIDPTDLSDPIKARLYAKLPDAAATLLRHGNRYPEVAGPARELVTLTSVAFDSADLLDIHLQLAALTDVRSADADRPLLERLDPDCRTALDAVLRIGPGVTLGHPDVDALEVRLAEYARLRQPATVAEGERRVTGALAEREELATERLRKVAGQVSKAGDQGRLPEYRRGFSRNVIIALGAVASGLTDAAQGYVYGEIALAAAQFLVLHRDAIMATAPAWGQTGYAWLEYILVRADLILRDAKSGHLNRQ